MREKPFIEGQLRGALIIVVLAFVFYSARWTFHYFQTSGGNSAFEFGDMNSGSLIVELSGDVDNAGIYYLPEGTKLSGFFDKAGINAEDLKNIDPDRTLSAGDKIVIGESSVSIETMDAATRLALDMPIDINKATVEELILIPGIGIKTATAIVELREKRGSFSHIDDLKGAGGLGRKKLEGIKKYLFLESS